MVHTITQTKTKVTTAVSIKIKRHSDLLNLEWFHFRKSFRRTQPASSRLAQGSTTQPMARAQPCIVILETSTVPWTSLCRAVKQFWQVAPSITSQSSWIALRLIWEPADTLPGNPNSHSYTILKMNTCNKSSLSNCPPLSSLSCSRSSRIPILPCREAKCLVSNSSRC